MLILEGETNRRELLLILLEADLQVHARVIRFVLLVMYFMKGAMPCQHQQILKSVTGSWTCGNVHTLNYTVLGLCSFIIPGVVGKTWQLHCVSPLHQFDWSKLRTYSHQLFSQLLSVRAPPPTHSVLLSHFLPTSCLQGSASSASIGIRCTVKLSVVLRCGQDGELCTVYYHIRYRVHNYVTSIKCHVL